MEKTFPFKRSDFKENDNIIIYKFDTDAKIPKNVSGYVHNSKNKFGLRSLLIRIMLLKNLSYPIYLSSMSSLMSSLMSMFGTAKMPTTLNKYPRE